MRSLWRIAIVSGTALMRLPAALIWIGVLSVVSINPVHADRTLRVGIVEVPTGILEVSGRGLIGVLATHYECVFTRLGLSVEFVSVPLGRGLYYLDRNQLDAVIPLARTPDRDKRATFAGELFTTGYDFVALKPLFPLSDGSEIRYGVLRGFAGAAFIPDSAASVERVSNGAQLMPMLQHDRIDIALMPSAVAQDVQRRAEEAVYIERAGNMPVSMYISHRFSQSGESDGIGRAVKECRP